MSQESVPPQEQHSPRTQPHDPSRIRELRAREILDSRGLPTVEVDVVLEGGHVGRASVPTGLSTGNREAAELRDGDCWRFDGMGVRAAVQSVTRFIAPLLAFADVRNQSAIDEALAELDGTARKEALGANAILAVSMAVARAAALLRDRPLYRSVGDSHAALLPLPLFNVLNGGAHADNGLDIEEFMAVPIGAQSFSDALHIGAEVYQALKAVLQRRGLATSVGTEGGFAPNLRSDVEALELVLDAVVQAGFAPGEDVVLALDVAAGRLFEDGVYRISGQQTHGLRTEGLVALYDDWVRQFPIASIEDGVAEQDQEGWLLLTERLGARVQLVGDDVFATQEQYLREGISAGIANAVLVRLNQVGTVTEAIATMQVARTAGYATIVSHRSGETADDFIADFAVATSAGQIKAGAPSRERVIKYNQLARIEEELGRDARFAGGSALGAWDRR